MRARPRTALHLALPVLASLASFAPLPARAQEPSAEQIAAARALGTEGVRLAEAGDCPGAVDKLSRAESLRHAPTTLERLGECHIALGKVVLGTEELQRVIREPLAPSAPAAFLAAQDRARAAVASALPRVARLRIHVERPPGVKPEVKVDDEVVFEAMLDNERPTDPGSHSVTVTGPGMKALASSVTLKDGDSQSVTFKLEADPSAVAALAPLAAPATPATTTAPPPSMTPSDVPAEPSGSGKRTAGFVILGVGGAGLVVGSVLGIMALGSKSTLDSACTDKACPASSQSDIDSLGSRATLSTVGFGVGIVGVAVGSYLLLTSGSSSAAASTPAAKVRVQPLVGVGTAGLMGSF